MTRIDTVLCFGKRRGESVSQWVSPWLKGRAENRKWVASTDDRKKKTKNKPQPHKRNETEQNRTN